MTATVNAKLLRIASSFVSTEATRYYLQGVLIQKHQVQGVNLVATDGNRMIVIWDRDGETTLEDIIVKLDKAALAACKPVKGESKDRTVKIDGDGLATVMSGHETPTPVAMNHSSVIDGVFPHWQRVVPSFEGERTFACFPPKHLNDFGKAAEELYADGKGGLSISASGENPALIRFYGVDHAFGLLMPFLKYREGNTLPWFLNAAPAEVVKAA